MVFEFHLPDIGEGVVEGEIVEWKVGEGDDVELDQPIVLVQTDKATVEIPSPRAGSIAQIRFQAGEICPVGDVLLVIDMGEDEAAAVSAPVALTPTGGNGKSAHAPVTAAPAAASTATSTGDALVVDVSGGTGRVLASPATRRLARELAVELAQVPPTGRNGRVTSDDVRAAHAARDTARESAGAPAGAPAPVIASVAPAAGAGVVAEDLEERIPLRGVRRKIAEKMTQSKFTATHFTYVEEVDMTELVAVRERAKARAAERGVKLTYLPFIVKAIVAGLKKWPALNASLDEERQEIVRKRYYHVGIAAQGPDGLVVTVVRDADKRSIVGLAEEIQRLSAAVQDGTIKREELVGSTFTISSLGAMGGVLATPIINFPEVGIVGVHRMSQRPAVVDGEIVPRWLMNLSISLDHRLVDGWDGASFLQEVKGLLEDPTLMFMEMI